MSDSPSSPGINDALAGVDRSIAQIEGCTPEEREALLGELRELHDLADKLRSRRVEVAVFGEISTGKSALINALTGDDVASVNVRGGWTREVWRTGWQRVEATGELADSQLVLVDTPGLNEVEGQARADMARDAAERSDLVLLVCDGDLNETEYSALETIASLHKPVLLVVNKTDLYPPAELDDLREAFARPRVAKLVGGPENIVFAAADPREVEYLIEDESGVERSELRQPSPDVDAVRNRVLEMLVDAGHELIALNAAMYAADRADRVAALRVRMRSNRADTLVWTYAAGKAVTVAMTPWPAADVIGGVAADATMVVNLAGVYGVDLTADNARELVTAILKAAGWQLAGQVAVSLGSSVLKAVSVGWSTAITAIPQAAAAGYGSWIVGQAARAYFEQGGSWGEGGPKRIITRILENTDKQSVIDRLKTEIQEKLRRK